MILKNKNNASSDFLKSIADQDTRQGRPNEIQVPCNDGVTVVIDPGHGVSINNGKSFDSGAIWLQREAGNKVKPGTFTKDYFQINFTKFVEERFELGGKDVLWGISENIFNAIEKEKILDADKPTAASKLAQIVGNQMQSRVPPDDRQRIVSQISEFINNVLINAYEKDYALEISKHMKDKIIQANKEHLIKNVYLTREGDVVEKEKYGWRMNLASNKGAQIFISVHLNSSEDRTPRGHVIIYRSDFATGQSKNLAEKISNRYNLIPGGIAVQNVKTGVLKIGGKSIKASVFAEVGFISNDMDRYILYMQSDEVAAQLSSGVLEYVQENFSILCNKR
jgi:N-acetylmuramoyl-L-alanine amidase